MVNAITTKASTFVVAFAVCVWPPPKTANVHNVYSGDGVLASAIAVTVSVIHTVLMENVDIGCHQPYSPTRSNNVNTS